MTSASAAPSTGRRDARGLHARIVEAATEITTTQGWASVTMARLAKHVGVSRQTVYNEVGSKPELAETMIMHELARFLDVVERAFDEHPEGLVDAIQAAAASVLRHAQGNALLHAVVSATHGADTELLPLLTTHSQSLMSVAKAVIARRLEVFDLDFTAHQIDAVIDMVVRVVLSHVMEPSGDPAETAADIAWVAGRVLGPTTI